MNDVTTQPQQQFKSVWFVAALIALAILLVLTHWPQEKMPDINRYHLDKIAHSVVYAGLAFLFFKAIAPGRTYLGWFGVICGLLCIAVLDEITQPFVNRQFDLFDIAADAVGIFACMIFMYSKSERSRQFDNTNLRTKDQP